MKLIDIVQDKQVAPTEENVTLLCIAVEDLADAIYALAMSENETAQHCINNARQTLEKIEAK